MLKDRFGQELRPGCLVVTATSSYGGGGTLEVGVITKINETVRENYYSEGNHWVTGTISMIKITYHAEYTNLHGTVRPEGISEKRSLMSNNGSMVIIQGPDAFTHEFPPILRERILLLMAEHTR